MLKRTDFGEGRFLKMETARPPSSNIGGLMRTVTKIIQFRRTTRGSGNGIVPDDESIQKGVKFSDYFEDSTMLSRSEDKVEDEKKLLQQKQLVERAAMESFLAKLFTSISAIKASYAQLQIGQEPYDPNTIQSADLEVISELKHLSELKASYQKKEVTCHHYSSQATQLEAELQEQQNLLKTFQITATKLESDLQAKDSEVLLLRDQLLNSENQSRLHEAKLFPRRSLSALDDLHPSGLNSTHFLTVLRYTVKSIRSFVKLMVQQMELSRWDLNKAATAIAPDVGHGKLEHRAFAFESYVCWKMFSDFQHCNFRLPGLNECSSWDRGRFFDEFRDSKSVKPKRLIDRSAGSLFQKFCRAKYLSLVHPKMEALLSSGQGFSNTPFLEGFTEMTRRVWLLHCLFFSFEQSKAEASIFQARRGCRFSEVYMESVAEDDDTDATEGQATVGFTVVPGFKVGKTVIQCRVYLARRNGR